MKCNICGEKVSDYRWNICRSCSAKERLKNPENNPNWRGGLSFEDYPQEFNNDLKERIRKRDNYTCQLCGITETENKKKLDCHHIDYNKKNNTDENLISLCVKCHRKTNYNRDYWKEKINDKIAKLNLH